MLSNLLHWEVSEIESFQLTEKKEKWLQKMLTNWKSSESSLFQIF